MHDAMKYPALLSLSLPIHSPYLSPQSGLSFVPVTGEEQLLDKTRYYAYFSLCRLQVIRDVVRHVEVSGIEVMETNESAIN